MIQHLPTRLITLFICLNCSLFSSNTHAQKSNWILQGVIQDNLSEPLNSATVTLLDPNDSTLIAFGVSNAQGQFQIKGLREEKLLIQVAFLGFEAYHKIIQKPTEGNELLLDTITLIERTTELDEFTLEDIAPITIKKDTIEYHADAFKTQPNANVEELLKRLPGVEVDQNGNIKAQGETVNRILVDGKEFFGTDPKIASKNLLAEAIEKVQILDRKSEQAQFTGIDDGQREKTINLKLKKDYKNGFFGNISAGYGPDQRYSIQGNANKFTENQQISFLGLSNNINEQGFSIDNYLNFQGGIQGLGAGGAGVVRITIGGGGAGSAGIPINNGQRLNGIMDSHGYGANLNQDFGKKTQLRSSYFLNNLNHQISQSTDRLNFFPSGNLISQESSIQDNQSTNHKINAIIDHKIDSLNSFRSTSSAQLNLTDRIARSETVNRDDEGNMLNSGNRLNLTTGSGYQANTEMLLRHRFKKPGKTISANLTFGLSLDENEGSLYAENEFFGDNPSLEIIQQEQIQKNENFSYGANISYTEPLGGRKYLELVYNIRQNRNKVNQSVFDREGENLVFNEPLSNHFNALYTYHRPGANVSYNAGSYNIVAGIALQATTLNGETYLTQTQVNNSFQNLLPSMNMNYSFSNTKNLTLNYQTNVNEPSIQQLQPVINNSDPLNIYIGNPNLRPAYMHSMRINYNSFDMGKFINLFANMFVNHTENSIVNAQSIDDRQIRTIIPVNVKNNTVMGGNFNLGFPLKAIHSRFNIGPNFNHNRSFTLLNDLEDQIKILNLGGNFRYDFTWKEYINFGLAANISRQNTAYNFNPQQNQRFINQSYSTDLGLNFLQKYSFNTKYNLLRYNSQTSDFDESIPLLNISLSRFVLKNNMGEVKLSCDNLLNQNIGIAQRADVNFIEQTVTNNLGRFYMLSFTYKMNNKANPLGNIRRTGSPTMTRIMN
ncbi:TonB-dependent receptor family protein [Belliella sp. DSM 111904]|uniref:TonB-dependent receptor family protein n=1 Tax=Belliella filtrata TaxID=2923435 RepID=A0ABS9V5E5_9BACT|nr:outer membrane beta-barrel protein [Belliella filtrata]MCH7411632.1 TonB-dependent receptor family protein [Belliella filtrata]